MPKPPKRKRIPGVPTPEEIQAEVRRRRKLRLPPLSTPTRAEQLQFQRMIKRALERWRQEQEDEPDTAKRPPE